MGATSPPGVRRRADAERNIAAILAAALGAFARDPEATMTDIARAAGVGRVTLYGHFGSRDVLLAAAIGQVLGEVDLLLDDAEVTVGPADEALVRLAREGWQVLDRTRGLRRAALKALGEASLRRHHARVLTRVDELVARGRSEGVIRTDLPATWLAATYYGVIHTAADEVDAGRLDRAAAGDTIAATLRSALAAPR
ncbi:TetR/AcrR family transcriptional regulator [Embleya scabrispora]|uniref:TetR/AcrR family transcriptional regulator n=1 Tax=Embleya scabrispora TaxID=159449 RepID=UPI0003764D2E|nr:TetR/AcrR family transcriptional regulator [Embleya scabrispora]MYS86029.1 TetR family transcriptional regulator [Streptomyces sp. SID5474]